MDGCSKEGRWVGFDEQSTHAHRIYWPEHCTVSVEQNIKFDEDFVLIPSASDTPFEGENSEIEVNQPAIVPPSCTPMPPPCSPTLEEPCQSAPIAQQYANGQPNYKLTRDYTKKSNQDAAMIADGEEDLELGGVEFAMGVVTLSAEGLDLQTVEEAQK